MSGREGEGSVTLASSRHEHRFFLEPPDSTFDWVDFKCRCPNCGAQVQTFQTKDLCNQLDTVDHRIVYHFYAECRCGAWIDFIRKPAAGIEDFDMHVEPS